MSGTGSLTKQGAGTLILSGSNTYTGGTTVSAGTLQGNTTSLRNNITNNSAVIFNQAAAGTYAGVMSGTGSLTKTGAGTLTLSGANTYTGGTTVSAGVLRGTSASLQGDIVNDASVQFAQTAAGTYAGNMSGTGSLVKQNGGTLILSGTNTYTGGTTVSGGILQGNTTSLQGNITNNATVTFDQAANGTFAGNMNGTGALRKQGAGTLILSGANTYSGGTNVSAGTLQGDSTSLQRNITNNAAVVFDQNVNGTYTGNMSGAGSLTKQGSGTLILTGSNTYTGGTTVSAGTLQGNTTSLRNNITNNAAVVFNQTTNATYGGVMSGTGSLTKTGGGTLTLSGAHTYTGGTTVSAGVLRGNSTNLQGDIVNDASVVFTQNANGAYAGNMSGIGSLTKQNNATLILSGTNTYTGGTIVSAGTLQGNTASIQGNIANSATVTFDQAGNGTYAGVVSGTGALRKQGSGTLTLSGNNTYTGATTVSAGRLDVNGAIAGTTTVQSGATLGGAGQVGSLINNGTVAPGNSIGTLTVNGNYTHNSGGTLEIEVDPAGPCDLLDVGGTATLNGGTVNVIALPGSFTAGTTYTFLTAGGGVNGTFAAVTHNFAFVNPQLIYGANDVRLLLLRNQSSFASVAATANQRAVAGALDSLSVYATGDMGYVIDNVVMLSAVAAQSAFDQMSGEIYGSLAAVDFENTTHYLTLIADRVRYMHSRHARSRLARPSPPDTSDSPVVQPVSYTRSASAAYSPLTDADIGSCHGPIWHAWTAGYGAGGTIDTDGNATALDYTFAGTVVGMDRMLDEDTVAGLAFGATPLGVDRSGGRDAVEADGYRLSLYGNHNFGPHYVLGVVGYAHNEYDASRRIAFGTINRTAQASFDGDEFSLYVESGLTGCWRSWVLQPLVGVQFIHLHHDDFAETGASALDLTLPQNGFDSLRLALGARIAHSFYSEKCRRIVPELRVRWMHEFLDDASVIAPGFSLAGGAFQVRGASLSRDFLSLGAGLTIELNDRVSLFGSYDAQISASENGHGGNGGLQVVW
jgi:outer membrane autotransporter protein